jgi:hypothetical protein
MMFDSNSAERILGGMEWSDKSLGRRAPEVQVPLKISHRNCGLPVLRKNLEESKRMTLSFTARSAMADERALAWAARI